MLAAINFSNIRGLQNFCEKRAAHVERFYRRQDSQLPTLIPYKYQQVTPLPNADERTPHPAGTAAGR